MGLSRDEQRIFEQIWEGYDKTAPLDQIPAAERYTNPNTSAGALGRVIHRRRRQPNEYPPATKEPEAVPEHKKQPPRWLRIGAIATAAVVAASALTVGVAVLHDRKEKAAPVVSLSDLRQARVAALGDSMALLLTGTCEVELRVMKNTLARKVGPLLTPGYPSILEYENGIERAHDIVAPCTAAASTRPYEIHIGQITVPITGDTLVTPYYNVPNLCKGGYTREVPEAEMNALPPGSDDRTAYQALLAAADGAC